MSDFVSIGRASEFREGRGRLVEVDGLKVAVFRTRHGFVAFSDACPHMGASLAVGRLVEADTLVECSWHRWRYDTRTGVSPARPWAKVTVYEVKLEGDEVFLRRPEPPAAGPAPEEKPWEPFDPGRHLRRRS